MRKIKRRRKIIIAALAVIAAAAIIHHYPRRRFGNGRVRLVITKTPLGRKLPGFDLHSAKLSSDCTRLAYVVKRGEKQAVVVDGQAGPEYDAVERLYFSPDGGRVAYAAGRGDKAFAVVDGVEGKEYDKVNWLCFSPDGRRLAYYAMRGDKCFVVIDGVEGKEYDQARPHVFSRDGGRLAYEARRQDKWLVVVDGEEGEEYDNVAWPDFSPDGSRLAYVADRAGKEFVVVDGVEGKEYDCVYGPYFSPDSERLAYAARRVDEWFGVLDGVEGKAYHGSSICCFTPRGKLFQWVKHDGKAFVILDGVEGRRYDNVGWPRLRSDGSPLTYAAEVAGEKFLVVDGVEGKRHHCKRISDVGLSPNGEHVWYTVECMEPFLYRLAREAEAWTGWINPFSGSSKKFLVVDGIEDKRHNVVSDPIFSADGKHVAYMAQRNDTYLWVVDGVERGQTDRVYYWGWIIDGSNELIYVDADNGEFFRIEARLEPE